MSTGSLVIIGLGIKLAVHLTAEAQAWLEKSDKLFFLANTLLVEQWVKGMRVDAVNLAPFYKPGKPRLETYQEMVNVILTAVREGHQVCAAFYGHPGIFVLPAHRALKQAQREGFKAVMLPGISAEDCLLAELEIDPAQDGCQSYEVTDFLLRPRQFDTHSGLLLWQVGFIGNLKSIQGEGDNAGVLALTEVLMKHYDPDHGLFIYQASVSPIHPPNIQHIHLHDLPHTQIPISSTMYIPPKANAAVDAMMVQRLGLVLDRAALEDDCTF